MYGKTPKKTERLLLRCLYCGLALIALVAFCHLRSVHVENTGRVVADDGTITFFAEVVNPTSSPVVATVAFHVGSTASDSANPWGAVPRTVDVNVSAGSRARSELVIPKKYAGFFGYVYSASVTHVEKDKNASDKAG